MNGLFFVLHSVREGGDHSVIGEEGVKYDEKSLLVYWQRLKFKKHCTQIYVALFPFVDVVITVIIDVFAVMALNVKIKALIFFLIYSLIRICFLPSRIYLFRFMLSNRHIYVQKKVLDFFMTAIIEAIYYNPEPFVSN